ncbi:hypothetical protein N9496_05800 [Akkermansiaceae bacterium]|nr:hypothetical protein [Akkermansiaceae bacterium]
MTHSLNTIRSKSSLGFILISLCWAFPLLAQQVQNKTSELGEDQVEAIVERLGDEDFKVRNKAYATLERMLEKDEKIDAHLQKFKNHDDPEISTRISGLLKQHEEQLKLKNELFEFQKQIAKLRLLEKQADGVWRIDPDDEKMMRSIDKKKSIHKIKLTFVNQSKQPVKIFTICAHKHKDEGGGNRNKHAKIEPGKTHNCKETWEKRVYVLTDMDDKALGLYLTGEKNAKIEFKGVPAAKK